MSEPLVTVFMPVHNRADLVGAAIDSVLAQTFTDFELLVIDDGSTDDSAKVIGAYRDSRVRLVVHDRNQGTPRTRNHGLDLARGRYVALLDSDDVAMPRRLEQQVAFLERRPDIAAVGSWAVGTSRDGRARKLLVRVIEPRDVRARIPFVSCFKNPTMTARTDVLREFRYREEFSVCQDIDIWARVSTRHALANLPAFLVRYRGGGGSHGDSERTRRMRMSVIRDCIDQLGVGYDDGDIARHEQLRNTRALRADRDFVSAIRDWLERLVVANRDLRAYPEPEFARAAAERWWLVQVAALRAGRGPTALSKHSPLRGHAKDVLGSYLRAARAYWSGPERFTGGRAASAGASGNQQPAKETWTR